MGFKSLFKTMLILCFIGGAAFGIYSLADNIKNSDMFAVNSIEVKGVINADRAALQKLSESFIGVSLFDKRLMDAIESDDPWVQRIVAKRALPDKVNLIVYEEISLFSYKDKKGSCYVLTGGGKRLPASCEAVNITVEGDIDMSNAVKFAACLERIDFLRENPIVLKDYSFEVALKGEVLRCPYDADLFTANFNIYQRTIKNRYAKVEYADLTVNRRIYVKGVLHAS